MNIIRLGLSLFMALTLACDKSSSQAPEEDPKNPPVQSDDPAKPNTDANLPPAPAPAAVSESGSMTVDSPRAGQIVPSQLKIGGTAVVYGNRVHVKINDEDGKLLVEGFGDTNAKEPGQSGTFEVLIDLPATHTGKTRVNVMGHSAKDGAPEHVVSFDVTVKPG